MTVSLAAVEASFSTVGQERTTSAVVLRANSLTAGQCFIDIDTVSYAGRTKRVEATANGRAADDGQLREHDSIAADVERIIGGVGNDFLGSGLSGMQLEGRAGNDGLRGGRGSDKLVGGRGNDVLRGAGGRDLLQAKDGDDRLIGGDGSDRLVGDRGSDRLLARDGQVDRVNGGAGSDEARVDVGLDHLTNIERLR